MKGGAMGTLDKLKAYLNGDSKALNPYKSNSKKKSILKNLQQH